MYEAACDWLNANHGGALSAAVRDIAWADCLKGGARWFAPQFEATSAPGGIARCDAGEDPLASVNFDTAMTYSRAMGGGWDLMNGAQWHVLGVISQAYWMQQGRANPTGQDQHGRSHAETSEVGIRSDALPVTGASQGIQGRTLTGLRKLEEGETEAQLNLPWSHDGTKGGVFLRGGGVWQWASGGRVNEGRIDIMPGSAGVQPDHGASSTAWRSLRPDGTLVATDAGGDMLHYDATSGIFLALARDGSGSSTSNLFRSLGAGAIDPVPPALIAHGLFPWSASVPTVGRLYLDTAGERLPIRGGSWGNGSGAGVAALPLNTSRGSAGPNIGFRPAFVI
jgi:hypothetical protein